MTIHEVTSLPKGEGATIYFETNQLDEKVERFRESVITFQLLPTTQSWLWREAHLRDPDKNKIILYFAGDNRKYPPWRINP